MRNIGSGTAVDVPVTADPEYVETAAPAAAKGYMRSAAGPAWSLLHACQSLVIMPVPALLARRYGAATGRRAAAGMALALGAQYAALVRMARRTGTRAPDAADALTLSRATGSAVLAAVLISGVRDRTGIAGRLSWGALLWGETISDWLDGALARRRGPTPLGAALDLEADSWLTLWAALSAVAWGDMPPIVALAPVLRYPLVAPGRIRPTASGAAWARGIGVAQMAVVTIGLSPSPLGPLRGMARLVAPAVAAASLCSLAAQHAARKAVR